ncbi:histidine kinase [Tenacibaculum sp. AHE15PA]|uniref:sensor histidine kinase n=1 Tax=unclassified Tenacibaculum TaxID=2635139 RepID=UPI001C4F5848|nr:MULTISPECIES: histidine kinase [unclassified Tenacibaculum]QXP73522.1 histidine kinase [Tenacibaculum sp. AHE14PA]QXP75036.1 histidine kinase [Tenacibaculum sp. AHE15PA]
MKKRLSILKFIIETAIHLLFWTAVYLFYTYFLGYGSENTAYINRFSLFLMPITIGSSYFFYFYLIPKYLLLKKQQLFILYTAYTFIISFFFIIVSIFYGLVFSDNLKTGDYTPITKGLIFITLAVYFIFFVAISIGLIINNYKSVLKNEDLKNKFLATQLQLKEQELKFLKMQIHPHFLFNTLNTLYGFALKKSDEAPDMILKLSNLLDYILYQVEKPLVFLNDEVNHIDDYISLEKMRFQDSLFVSFDKEIHQENIQIAPMLLLPFVENSFKHGAQIDGVLKVDIKLKTANNLLFFEIKNSTKNNTSSKKGIGLENIKKRLEMLYGKSYHLDISQTKNSFRVELKTPLKND